MGSVQFFGKDAVLNAMENRGCASWALFSGRQFLFKSVDGTDLNESATLLDKILDSISHSEAVYTIKFFEDKIKIKENSPCDGSFNFKLVGEDERASRSISYSNNSRQVMDELQKINMRLTEIENEEPEDEEKNMLGQIMDLTKNPEIIGLIKTVLAAIIKPVPAPPTKLAGVNRWQVALTTLQKKGVTIDHFEKLAAMDQTKIAMLINMM